MESLIVAELLLAVSRDGSTGFFTCLLQFGDGILFLYTSSVGDWFGLGLSHFSDREDFVLYFVSQTLVYCAKFVPRRVICAAFESVLL